MVTTIYKAIGRVFVSALVITFLCVTAANAQKRNILWFIGYDYTGGPDPVLNFYSGQLDTGAVYSNIMFSNTNNSMCDENGNLLFYTNGAFVRNANHQQLSGSLNFNHAGGILTLFNQSSAYMSQSAVSIPAPGDSSSYYIFHIEGEPLAQGGYAPLYVYYSKIEFSQAMPLGHMALVNNTCFDSDTLSFGTLAAVRHANGRDWWITVRKKDSGKFYSMLFTPQGVQPNPVVSVTGPPDHFYQINTSVFSKDGTQYAFMQPDSNTVAIYDFDRCSGQFQFREQFQLPSNAGNAAFYNTCEFSASGRYLYVAGTYYIWQYDMQAANIESSMQLAATWDGFSGPSPSYFNLLRRTPDNKIYVIAYNTNHASIIDQPDSTAASCNVIQHCINLGSIQRTLPLHPDYYNGPVVGSLCDTLILGNAAEPTEALPHFSVYMDAGSDELHIVSKNMSGQLDAAVYNIQGQLIIAESFRINGGGDELIMPFVPAANGIYLVVLRTRDKVFPFKVSVSGTNW